MAHLTLDLVYHIAINLASICHSCDVVSETCPPNGLRGNVNIEIVPCILKTVKLILFLITDLFADCYRSPSPKRPVLE